MPYLDQNLLPNEKVLYRAYIHPIIYFPCIAWFGAFILHTVITYVLSQDDSIFIGNGIIQYCFIGFFFFLAIYQGIKAIIMKNTIEFGITNQRIIAKTGFIRRNTIEMLLAKTESVRVDQGIFGRLLGYGTVIVVGTGGSKEKVFPVDNPMKVRKIMNRVIEEYHKRLAAANQPVR